MAQVVDGLEQGDDLEIKLLGPEPGMDEPKTPTAPSSGPWGPVQSASGTKLTEAVTGWRSGAGGLRDRADPVVPSKPALRGPWGK